MLLWIALWSQATTPTFTQEFVELLGTISFWATVLLSVILALGRSIPLIHYHQRFIACVVAPRFVIKVVSTTYYPMDRDLVREMWVLGDLKDRLGIQRRRNRRKGSPEHVPMFEPQYHERSISDISRSSIEQSYSPDVPDPRGIYAPTGTQSPPEGLTPRSNATFSDLPPDSRILQPVDVSYVVSDDTDWDTVTPIQRGPPPEPPISRVSYYSVSDIPPPSPLDESNVYSPTSSRPVTMTSLATGPVTQEYLSPTTLPSSSHSSSPPPTPRENVMSSHSPHAYPGAAAYPGEYEMRVRSPSRTPPHLDRAASHGIQQSFFPVREGGDSDTSHSDHEHGTGPRPSYEDDRATIMASNQAGDYDPWRASGVSQASDFTTSGPHAL